MSQSRLDFILGARDNASKEFIKVARAFGKFHKGMTTVIEQEERAAKTSYKLKKSLRDLKAQANRTGRTFRSLGAGIKVFAAGAGVFAAIRMGQAILGASRSALRFEGQLASLGGSVDDNRLEMENLQKQVDHTFSLQSLVSAQAKVKAFNLPLQLTPNLLKSIQSRSAAMGISTEFALHSMIEGLAKGERRILDNLSIVLHATQTYDKYAKSIGKTRKQLNKAEEQTAIVLETQRQLEENTGNLPAKVKRLYQAEALAVDAQRELNEAMAEMQPIVTAAMFGIAGFANQISDSGVLGGLRELALAIEEVGVAQVFWNAIQGKTTGKTPFERRLEEDPKITLNFWREQAAKLREEEIGFVRDLGWKTRKGTVSTIVDFLRGDVRQPRKDWLTFLSEQDTEITKRWAKQEMEVIDKRAKELLGKEMQARNKAAQFAERERLKRLAAQKAQLQKEMEAVRKANKKKFGDQKAAAAAAKKALQDRQAIEMEVKKLQLAREQDKMKRLIIKRDTELLRIEHEKEKGMNKTLAVARQLTVNAQFEVDKERLLADLREDARRRKEKEEKKERKSLKDSPEVLALEELTRSLQTTANAMGDVSRKGAVVWETMGDLVDIEAQVKKGILEKDKVAAASIGIIGRGAAEFVESERAKAGILAAMEFAQGFATLATPKISAGHFAAAALFGAVAAGAGGGSSQPSGGTGTEGGEADTMAGGAGGVGGAGGQPQQANIVVNFSDGVVLGSRQDIGRGIIEATKSLNKTGISAGAV